jgi:hypothetical protein
MTNVLSLSRKCPAFRKFVQLFARGRLCRQGAHYQASGRTAESPSQQVAGNLPLRLLFGRAGLVDVRSETLAADEQTLLGHQLHRLQRGGVADVLAEFVVDFPHRRHSQAPEEWLIQMTSPCRNRSPMALPTAVELDILAVVLRQDRTTSAFRQGWRAEACPTLVIGFVDLTGRGPIQTAGSTA